MNKGLIVGLIGVGMFALVLGSSVVSISNTEIELRNSIGATQKSNEAVYDRVWKTISQSAGVTNAYKNGFREVFNDVMKNRYQDGGQGRLMKWVQEANVNFDSSMYSRLMTVIESNRLDFEREQKRLLDLSREHNNTLQRFPNNIVLSILGRQPIAVQIVTSDKTNEAFSSGVDNDVELFNNK
jgi:hypothetical protein